MSHANPNAQIEANLLEGKGRYASAGTTLQDIKSDLDSIAAGLQSSWFGEAYQAYQDKHGKLTTTVQKASDVLQKGSINIGKMYDAYIEADKKQKAQELANEDLQMFLGVFMLVTALLGLIGPILEAADLVFAAGMDALDVAVEMGDVTTNVMEDLTVDTMETVSSIDDVSTLGNSTLTNDDVSTLDASPNVNTGTSPEDQNIEPYQIDNTGPNVGDAPAADHFTPGDEITSNESPDIITSSGEESLSDENPVSENKGPTEEGPTNVINELPDIITSWEDEPPIEEEPVGENEGTTSNGKQPVKDDPATENGKKNFKASVKETKGDDGSTTVTYSHKEGNVLSIKT